MRPKKMVQSDQGSRAFCNVGRELKSTSVDTLSGSRQRAARPPWGGQWTSSTNNTLCAAVFADGPGPAAHGGWMEMRGPHGRPGDYAIQDRDGTRLSQGRSARTGNRRRNKKVSSCSGLRKREARLLTHPCARALVENPVHGRKIWGPRDLQEARIGSRAQDRPRR